MISLESVKVSYGLPGPKVRNIQELRIITARGSGMLRKGAGMSIKLSLSGDYPRVELFLSGVFLLFLLRS